MILVYFTVPLDRVSSVTHHFKVLPFLTGFLHDLGKDTGSGASQASIHLFSHVEALELARAKPTAGASEYSTLKV